MVNEAETAVPGVGPGPAGSKACGWSWMVQAPPFGKQFKRADRSGARWAVVLGDEEAERGEVRLKPLQQQGEEIAVALSGIAAIVEILSTP